MAANQRITRMQGESNGCVLFADVSGSTKLYEMVGDKAAHAAIDLCVKLFSALTEQHGGRVGDAAARLGIREVVDDHAPSLRGQGARQADEQARAPVAARAVRERHHRRALAVHRRAHLSPIGPDAEGLHVRSIDRPGGGAVIHCRVPA